MSNVLSALKVRIIRSLIAQCRKLHTAFAQRPSPKPGHKNASARLPRTGHQWCCPVQRQRPPLPSQGGAYQRSTCVQHSGYFSHTRALTRQNSVLPRSHGIADNSDQKAPPGGGRHREFYVTSTLQKSHIPQQLAFEAHLKQFRKPNQTT